MNCIEGFASCFFKLPSFPSQHGTRHQGLLYQWNSETTVSKPHCAVHVMLVWDLNLVLLYLSKVICVTTTGVTCSILSVPSWWETTSPCRTDQMLTEPSCEAVATYDPSADAVMLTTGS